MHWDDNDEWGHMDDGAAWAWMVGGTLLLVILVAAAVVLVVLVARRPPATPPGPMGSPPLPPGPDPAAMRILQQRFASGEIDEDEFRIRSEALRAHGGG